MLIVVNKVCFKVIGYFQFIHIASPRPSPQLLRDVAINVFLVDFCFSPEWGVFFWFWVLNRV